MIFLEQICCAISDKMSFEFFYPIWLNGNEHEKKLAKIQNLKFRQSLYNFGRDPS